jgi:glycine/D-amino acid oxidase-like deaminating enzyme
MKKFLVTIVGAGIIGLTSAKRILAKLGDKVHIRIVHHGKPLATPYAGALGLPFKSGGPQLADFWRATYAAAQEDVKSHTPGVTMSPMRVLFGQPEPLPSWAPDIPDFASLSPEELIAGAACGYAFKTPVWDPQTFTPNLLRELSEGGVDIINREIHRLEDLAHRADFIIDAAGLGSRAFGDTKLRAGKGQVLVVRTPYLERNDTLIMEEDLPDGNHRIVYYTHRRPGIALLGGTFVLDDEDMTPDPNVTSQILENVIRVDPTFRDAEIIAQHVGLRPYRDQVRVELSHLGYTPCLHLGGTGGAGYSIATGMADQAAEMLTGLIGEEELRPRRPDWVRSSLVKRR